MLRYTEDSENSQEFPTSWGDQTHCKECVPGDPLFFSSARDEASILVCHDYMWQSWVEIEHYFEHITTFEALLHKTFVRVGCIA